MSACTDGGDTLCDVARPTCEGWSASWCPVCGDCTCPYHEGYGRSHGEDERCPLHGVASAHAEGEHER